MHAYNIMVLTLHLQDEHLNGKTAKEKEIMELQSEDEKKKFDVTAT